MLTKNFQKLQSEVAAHVGCLANGKNDPEFVETEYGIPLMVSRIAESIFEDLPAEEAPLFFAAFPAAVGCDGKDLSRVPWQFLAAELRSLPAMPDDVQAVIDPVIAGMDLLAQGKEWPEAQEAQKAARWSAYAADAAAYAAAKAAAKAAANVANVAAYEAANAAAYVAANAANAFAFRRQRDLLLKLVKEAPVVAVEGE